MDKIVLICKKFDLNIDDLLYKDINEAKDSAVIQNKVKSGFDKILDFLVNSFESLWDAFP